MIYTGIGARSAPELMLVTMRGIGYGLAEAKDTLRSGGANGADTAFEIGCDQVGGKKEIYLPWENFNNNKSPLFYQYNPDAEEIAKDAYGPQWKHSSRAVQKFMTRNVYQVLGITLDEPSDFVVCYTPDGCERASDRSRTTGGTGQAITIADWNNIPVFNLFNGTERFLEYFGVR